MARASTGIAPGLVIALIAVLFAMSACDLAGGGEDGYYAVRYSPNGATSGSAPASPAGYRTGTLVTVEDNRGNYARTDYAFAGWNTSAGGTGTTYPPGASLTVGSSDVTLYANWSLWRYLLAWGSAGSADGQFGYSPGTANQGPQALAVDSTGAVYVADALNNRIQKFDSNGNFVRKWGSSGSGNGLFNFPSRLCVDSANNVYVVDSGNYRVQKFDSNGTYVSQFGGYGTGNGQFNFGPYCGIGVDPAGNLYVLDGGNNRVQKFSSAGTYLAKFGGSGANDGQFVLFYHANLAVDSAGNVFVADSGNNRVVKFDSSGAFVSNISCQVGGCTCVALGPTGSLFVMSGGAVYKYAADGTQLLTWRNNGTGTGQVYSPASFAVGTGALYFLDFNEDYVSSSNSRIEKFQIGN